MARADIRFLRRGRTVSLPVSNPMQTVLDYLRLDEKSRGTKEGCNEGDCGACTVALGRLRDGRLVYESVNACILLVGQLHGCELVTVEDLAESGVLHPVQQAMVDCHGSQCGFCTPGFVMSLFTLYHAAEKPNRQDVLNHLAGKLCRCTGYRPIIDAALQACTGRAMDAFAARADQTRRKLAALVQDEDVFCGTPSSFLALPNSAQSLARLAQEHPDATIVSGATDVGLWITKQLRNLPKVILTGQVAELHRIQDRLASLSLGAAVTYAAAMPALAAISPDIGEVMRRIGSAQVRNSGTIGGNIANGSPIGDMPPMLIALGARVTLRLGEQTRDLALEDFYIAYGKQDRKPGELVWRIDIPKPQANEQVFAHKISKRFDQDISSVMAAFRFTVVDHKIVEARLAFGGMAATPRRASKTEAALKGLSFAVPEAWQKPIATLAQDFTPLSDMRASADYRLATAQALLHKGLLGCAGEKRPDMDVLAARAVAQ